MSFLQMRCSIVSKPNQKQLPIGWSEVTGPPLVNGPVVRPSIDTNCTVQPRRHISRQQVTAQGAWALTRDSGVGETR